MRAWFAVLLVVAPASAQQPATLTVMSFNVRVPVDVAPARQWRARLPVAAAAIRRADPDVIGTQELRQGQGDDLVAALPGYRWFGRDRRGGHGDEHMGVFYRADRLRLVRSGDFWLSDTPAVPGSISWGNVYPRMVTWGLFERRADRRRFMLYNTHFPYRAEDAGARERAAVLIVTRLAALPGDLPIVLTGDFNSSPAEAPYARLTAILSDSRATARRIDGPDATFHAFEGKASGRIDWILARGLVVERAGTLTDRDGGVWPSDHFPIVARFAWPVWRAGHARR